MNSTIQAQQTRQRQRATGARRASRSRCGPRSTLLRPSRSAPGDRDEPVGESAASTSAGRAAKSRGARASVRLGLGTAIGLSAMVRGLAAQLDQLVADARHRTARTAPTSVIRAALDRVVDEVHPLALLATPFGRTRWGSPSCRTSGTSRLPPGSANSTSGPVVLELHDVAGPGEAGREVPVLHDLPRYSLPVKLPDLAGWPPPPRWRSRASFGAVLGRPPLGSMP